jgi:hypothetical protein
MRSHRLISSLCNGTINRASGESASCPPSERQLSSISRFMRDESPDWRSRGRSRSSDRLGCRTLLFLCVLCALSDLCVNSFPSFVFTSLLLYFITALSRYFCSPTKNPRNESPGINLLKLKTSPLLQLPPSLHRLQHRHLIRILQIRPHGNPHANPRHPYPQRLH